MASPHIPIAIGIIIGLLASFIQSLGLTIQRKSHVLNQSLPEIQRRSEYRRPIWWLGFVIFITSNVLGSVFQIASLPVVILAPLGAVSLLWNAFFARLLLGDVFSAWMLIGTLFIAGGAVLIAIFGIVPEPTRSIGDLLVLFNRPAFIAYFSFLGFVLAVCLLITHTFEWSFQRRLRTPQPSPSLDPVLLPPSTDPIGTAHAMTEQTPLLDRKGASSRASSISFRSWASKVNVRSSRLPFFLAISYASASGIVSGMCLLFAKSGVELLLLTIAGDNQFWRWQAWCLLVGLVAFALLQVWYLHKALILADPTVVCPLAFCFYNLSSIINGLVYFDQLSIIPGRHLLLVALGIAILLGGVWVVSINSGDGGVDVGTWQESADDDISSVFERDDDADTACSICTLADSEQGPSNQRPSVTAVPMERATVSESHVGFGHQFPCASSTRNSGSRLSSPTHERRQTESSVLPLPNSHLFHGTRMRRRYQTVNADSAQPNYNSSNALSPTVAGGLSVGLSIGLSPASPGFIIVPKERRRRVSGITVDSQERRSSSRRRSLSDSNVFQFPPQLSNTSGIASENTEDVPEDPCGSPASKARWR